MNKSSRNRQRTLWIRLRRTAAAHPQVVKYGAITIAVLALLVSAVMGYYYVTFAREIDARLHGERERVLPRVFGRPLEFRRGEGLTQQELVDRLNDLGYAQRTLSEKPGEFAVNGGVVNIVPRAGSHAGKTVVVSSREHRLRPSPTARPRSARWAASRC